MTHRNSPPGPREPFVLDHPARVLLVDDSRLFRSALEKALQGIEGISIAGSVFNGCLAMEMIRQHPPDLVTLDFEMPLQDGLVTLGQIMDFNRSRPGSRPVGVVMLSSHTRAGAEVSMKALEMGAFDFVPKPSVSDPEAGVQYLRDQLLPRFRAFLRHRGEAQRASGLRPATPPRPANTPPKAVANRLLRAILIAVSTGGPRALGSLLPGLKGLGVPIFVVQHMPPEFTSSMAGCLCRSSGLEVVEATDNEPVRPNVVHLAPGGKHLVLRHLPGQPVRTGLSDLPPEEGCRPSANYLFRTAASVYGGECAALMLTGMGRDGVAGLPSLRRQGALIIAQDEASSVVWGMPGSAVEAGLVDMVLPLDQIPGILRSMRVADAKPSTVIPKMGSPLPERAP